MLNKDVKEDLKKFIFRFLAHIRQYNIDAFVVGSDKNTDCLFKYFKSAIFARPNGIVSMAYFIGICPGGLNPQKILRRSTNFVGKSFGQNLIA